MKVALLGPTLTSACRDALGVSLSGAPEGTAQTPLAPLAAGLMTFGHEVHIITTDPNIESPETIQEGNFSITYCPLRGGPRYRARTRSLDLFEREICSIEQALRASAPDIVHAHWTYEFAEAAVRSGLPHVVTMHDLGWDCLGIYRDPYRAMRLLMKYRVMPRVRNLTVVAPFMAKKARQYGYFGHVDVVPNGLAVPGPVQPSAPRGPDWGPKIFTIGNPGPIKNVRASVEAFKLVRRSFPTAELHLFGPGLDRAWTSGEPNIFGHGNVDHGDLMRRLESEATILVHPSRLETFGMIIAESKARSVPVVAGKHSGGVSYVCNDSASVLVDIESPEMIADAIIGIVSSPDNYDRLRQLSHKDAFERLSIDKSTTRFVEIYARILNVLRVTGD